MAEAVVMEVPAMSTGINVMIATAPTSVDGTRILASSSLGPSP